uniref:Uncharacterized protein n=1 Tax=Parasteatoda tepidariorum TaxID=114398 RepID=A0A2L2ZAB2_PARTP
MYFYVLPMLLGRTYDIKTESPGVVIFPQEVIDSSSIIKWKYSVSHYRMVSDTQEA